MGTPYLGEIRLMSFNFPPKAWALCNGGLMPINQNQPLFSLLGTTYGGNGSTTFALPDLRGRVPMHYRGNTFPQGERAGETAHTLTVNELPTHTHTAFGTSSAGTTNVPTGMLLANANLNAYATQNPPQNIEPGTIAQVGGSQPHNNMSPYLVMSYCICLQGFFPSHS